MEIILSLSIEQLGYDSQVIKDITDYFSSGTEAMDHIRQNKK